jgi:hypothetical protein
MCKWASRKTAVLSAAVLAAAISITDHSDAVAQNRQLTASELQQLQQITVRQRPLTEKQVLAAEAAGSAIERIIAAAPEGADKPSPETLATLDAAAKVHGLASYDEYKIVGENVGLVCEGVDAVTRKYVGYEAAIKLQIARVKADKKMSADEKNEDLSQLDSQLRSPMPPVQYRRNIDLATKFVRDGI